MNLDQICDALSVMKDGVGQDGKEHYKPENIQVLIDLGEGQVRDVTQIDLRINHPKNGEPIVEVVII